MVLTDYTWAPSHARKTLHSTRFHKVSQYLENSFSWTPVNIFAIYAGSDHEYTLSAPTAVANNADWLHFNTFPSWEDTLPRTTGFFNTWKNSFSWTPVNIFAIYAGSDHEYTLSEPTAVANGADWLHLSTFPCSKDTLQGSTRFLNTWKTVSHELQSTIFAIYTGSNHEYTLT